MQNDHDDITPPTSDDPEIHARDAVEAMRARGTNHPDVERAILGAGRQHADFLKRQAMSTEDWR